MLENVKTTTIIATLSSTFIAYLLLRRFIVGCHGDLVRRRRRRRRNEEKVVLITGCDTGFGKTAADALADLGFSVIACCLSTASPGAVSLLRKHPSNVKVVKLDFLVAEDLDQLRRFVQSECSKLGLWALVNNAARTSYVSSVLLTPDQIMTKYMEVNFFGAVRMMRMVMMMMKDGARIVNVSSLTASLHLKHLSMYSASKAALEAVSDSLRQEVQEMKGPGVRVCVIKPSGFITESMCDAVLDEKHEEVLRCLMEEMSVNRCNMEPNNIMEANNNMWANNNMDDNNIMGANNNNNMGPNNNMEANNNMGPNNNMGVNNNIGANNDNIGANNNNMEPNNNMGANKNNNNMGPNNNKDDNNTTPLHPPIHTTIQQLHAIHNDFKRVSHKSCSNDCSAVVEAIVDCVTSENPRSYYYVGSGSLLLSIASSLLPTRLLDWLTR